MLHDERIAVYYNGNISISIEQDHVVGPVGPVGPVDLVSMKNYLFSFSIETNQNIHNTAANETHISEYTLRLDVTKPPPSILPFSSTPPHLVHITTPPRPHVPPRRHPTASVKLIPSGRVAVHS